MRFLYSTYTKGGDIAPTLGETICFENMIFPNSGSYRPSLKTLLYICKKLRIQSYIEISKHILLFLRLIFRLVKSLGKIKFIKSTKILFKIFDFKRLSLKLLSLIKPSVK